MGNVRVKNPKHEIKRQDMEALWDETLRQFHVGFRKQKTGETRVRKKEMLEEALLQVRKVMGFFLPWVGSVQIDGQPLWS